MGYRDYRNLRDSVNNLNKTYGNFFGYKVLLYTVVVSLIYMLVVLGIQGIKTYKDHKGQFILDSNRKYIISTELPETNSYYEVDFSKGKVIHRKDSDELKREKIGEVKNNLGELEKMILNIINDKNNLMMTDEERTNLYRQNCYWIYKITTCEQQDYYIKDINDIQYLKELLR